MNRDLRPTIIILLFILLLILVITSFYKNHDKLVRIVQLETELRLRLEQAEREQEYLKELREQLIEENRQLKERIQKYENLSGYIEDSFINANNITREEARELTNVFWEQVKLYELDPWKSASWIYQESQFKITAVSHKGAVGLTQIMPKTGQEIARKMGIRWEGQRTLLNPENSLKMGFYHLGWGRKNSINEHQAYSMYFWGYGNVKKKGLVETAYSRSIFERADKLRSV
jgi:soluble lytic murein transglycosylase-like protein